MHTGPVPGEYEDGWKPTNSTTFTCRRTNVVGTANGRRVIDPKLTACDSTNIEFRKWESSCGGYEDYHYRCRDCGYDWWVDGDDG